MNMDMQDSGSRCFLPPCRVCGDKAAGFHYGVNTCEACKGFFHRSLRRHLEYKCRADRTFGYCEYKPGKRKSCQFCRYQRCLQAGMSRDAIKTGRYTYLKRTEDTREVKRLQCLGYQLTSSISNDSSDLLTPPGSSWFTSSGSMAADLLEMEEVGFAENVFDESDSVTDDKFGRLFESDSDLGSFAGHIFGMNSLLSKDSSTFKRQRKQTTSTRNNNCYSKCGRIAKQRPLSSQESLKPLFHGHAMHTNKSSLSTRFLLSHTIDSRSAQHNHPSRACASHTNMSLDKGSSSLTRRNLLTVPDNRTLFRNSVVYRLLKDAETSDIEGSRERNMIDKYDVNSSNHELTPESDCKILAETAFELFPDISFCLNEQSSTSPCFLRYDDSDSSSVLESSGLSSSLSSHSSASSDVSPTLSPRQAITDMDRGFGSYVGENWKTEDDQCCTSELNYPNEDQLVFPHKIEGDDTIQITDEYSKDLAINEESRCRRQTSPVHTLLTSPPASDLTSDIDYLHEASPTSSHLSEVEIMPPSDVSELYRDKNAIIAMLMVSHKENVEDYSYIPKEEMLAQQTAHYEASLLKKQTFGDLGFLQEQEYDDIYSITGIDVDNRRLLIHKYLAWIEKQVRGLVQFAKSIPGFSYLDINVQTELIKLARPEFSMLTMYTTVNLNLGITLGLTGEHWACDYELGTDGAQSAIADYMIFSDKLQKMAPTKEEEVLLKAILVVSTDRDNSVHSPLAEVIRWQLFQCLLHSLKKNREQPSLYLARYIMALTQSRTVAESCKDFLRQLKLRKYSSIEENPLLWEMYSWIILDKRDDDREQDTQMAGEEVVGLKFLWLLGCPLAL